MSLYSLDGERRYKRTGALAFVMFGVMVAGVALAAPASAIDASTAIAPIASTTDPVTSASVSLPALNVDVTMNRRPTVTTLRTATSVIYAGQTIPLVGITVHAGTTTRVRSQMLRLQVKTTTGWKTIAWPMLSSTGYATYRAKPIRTTTYRYVYYGQGYLATSISAAKTITVQPVTASSKVSIVLAAARAQTGKWYRWGAAGPTYFDCSGLTQYVFKKVGIILPHKADAQKSLGRAVSRTSARAGDLVFFLSGSGYAYHVGIYAGDGYMYDAPRSGYQVGKHRIWSSNVVFRRLI